MSAAALEAIEPRFEIDSNASRIAIKSTRWPSPLVGLIRTTPRFAERNCNDPDS
jgi:hypothetical protein